MKNYSQFLNRPEDQFCSRVCKYIAEEYPNAKTSTHFGSCTPDWVLQCKIIVRNINNIDSLIPDLEQLAEEESCKLSHKFNSPTEIALTFAFIRSA